MAENMWEKYRGERETNLSKGPKHGKQNNQKLKPYLVLQYLLKYSDEKIPNTFACRLFFSWRIFLMGFFLITKSLSSQLKNTRRLRM